MPTSKTPTSAAPAAPAKAAKAVAANKAAALVKQTKAAVKPAVKAVTRSATMPVVKPVPKPTRKAPQKVVEAPSKATKPRDKLVRDSFTMPRADFVLIDVLKLRALGFKRPTKKSELLRAGLQALAAMPAEGLQAVLGQLVPLKTGRPKKGA